MRGFMNIFFELYNIPSPYVMSILWVNTKIDICGWCRCFNVNVVSYAYAIWFHRTFIIIKISSLWCQQNSINTILDPWFLILDDIVDKINGDNNKFFAWIEYSTDLLSLTYLFYLQNLTGSLDQNITIESTHFKYFSILFT